MGSKWIKSARPVELDFYCKFHSIIKRTGIMEVLQLLLNNPRGLSPLRIEIFSNITKSQTQQTLRLMKKYGLINSRGHNYYANAKQKEMIQEIINLALKVCLFKSNNIKDPDSPHR